MTSVLQTFNCQTFILNMIETVDIWTCDSHIFNVSNTKQEAEINVIENVCNTD